jgi:hypothetical protein
VKEIPRVRLLFSVFVFFFFLAPPCEALSIPSDLVQIVHTAASQESCTGVCNLTVPFPNATLASNLLKMDFSWRYSGTAPTVSNIYCNSDSAHATWTWTLAKSVLNVADTTDTFSYYVGGAAAGCKSVTIVASAVWTNAEATFKEYREIATSSPVDATGGGVDSGTSPSFAATVTTTVANDLIDQFCTLAPMPFSFPQSTSLATASSGFTALDLDIVFGYGSMAEIDSSTGSVTGTINFVGGPSGGDGNCTTVAFKTSGGAGTIPVGVHIVQQNDQNMGGTPNPKLAAHVFNSNDALIFVAFSGAAFPNQQWTGFSDSLGNSFTAYNITDATSVYPEWELSCNATSGDDLFSPTGGSTGDWNIVILEVAGLKNSSAQACFDNAAKINGNNAPYTNAPTITPSHATDLVLAMIEEGLGPITGITSPAAATYDYPTFTGQNDADDMTEGGGFSILYNAGTSALTWNWSGPNSASWWASAIALLAGSSQATPPNPPTGLQATVQ